MEEDFQWFSISSHNDQFTDSSVESFGGFVGSFLDLLETGCLLNQVHDSASEFIISKRSGSRIDGHDRY